MDPSLEIVEDRETLAASLAGAVVDLASGAVASRGLFSVAIPGGSVVPLLGRGLAGIRPDVAAWHWLWVDERCVPRDDPQSNMGQAARDLFQPLGIAEACIHAPDGARGPEGAAQAYEADGAAFFGTGGADDPRLDLVVLGVGEDGHVASLFPGHSALAETRRRVVPVFAAPKPPPERISLSLPVINRARAVWVVAAGAGKAEIVRRIFSAEASPPLLPVQRVRPGEGRLRWWLDRAAAAGLPESIWSADRNEKEGP